MQNEAQQQLDDEWRNPRGNHIPGMGEAFAQLYIPAFGSDYHYAVLEGTDDDTLLAGPGHYSDTQMPDEAGNFALAGHRVGKGAPFNDLGHLNTCDAIVVETRSQWFTYRVLPMEEGKDARTAASSSCLPDAVAREVADGRVITLTTCHPQFSNAERMIIHAVQTDARDKSAGPPPAMTRGCLLYTSPSPRDRG